MLFDYGPCTEQYAIHAVFTSGLVGEQYCAELTRDGRYCFTTHSLDANNPDWRNGVEILWTLAIWSQRRSSTFAAGFAIGEIAARSQSVQLDAYLQGEGKKNKIKGPLMNRWQVRWRRSLVWAAGGWAGGFLLFDPHGTVRQPEIQPFLAPNLHLMSPQAQCTFSRKVARRSHTKDPSSGMATVAPQ